MGGGGRGISHSKMALKSDYDFHLEALKGLAQVQESTDENNKC